MKSNRKSSGFSYLILAALLVGIALFGIDLPAKAETPQAPDLHGSCVFAVQDWHNTEYLQAPGCYVAPSAPGREEAKAQLRREYRELEQSVDVSPAVDNNEPPVMIDNGGETIPDTNSGQQNNTTHGGGSNHAPKEPKAPKDNKKDK